MAELRPPQLETLRAITRCDGQKASAAHTGAFTAKSLRAERTRLKQLERAGYVEETSELTAGHRELPVYSLTPAGEEELRRAE